MIENVLNYGYCLAWNYYLELQFIPYTLSNSWCKSMRLLTSGGSATFVSGFWQDKVPHQDSAMRNDMLPVLWGETKIKGPFLVLFFSPL